MQATRTYLQLNSPQDFRPAFGPFPEVTLTRETAPSADLYRECYRSVGEAYHWRDRWDWSDAEIRRHLADPAISLHVARSGGRLAGWYELRRLAQEDSVEIAYFGVVGDQIGRGFGKHLLSCAVRDAWALGPQRVWLHTCTLDHPHALPNYVKRGFEIYKKETYEVTT